MQAAPFLLLLVCAHLPLAVECKPRLMQPQWRPHQRSSHGPNIHPDTSIRPERSHSQLQGSVTDDISRGTTVILPLRTQSGNFVSIFDLRRKRFLCVDFEGQLYISRHKDKHDCLFQRTWSDVENHHGAFYATNVGRLLKLTRAAEGPDVPEESPGPSSAVLDRFLGSLVKRRRRSDVVNPSDPLKSETHPTHPVNDNQDADQAKPDPNPAGAVSKETIASCDDPLQVLHTDELVSPVKTNIADRAEQD